VKAVMKAGEEKGGKI